jgi:hypothetical protein
MHVDSDELASVVQDLRGLVPTIDAIAGCGLDGDDLKAATNQRSCGDPGSGPDLDRTCPSLQFAQLDDVVEESVGVTGSIAVVRDCLCIEFLRR